jgi:hypothetical protein
MPQQVLAAATGADHGILNLIVCGLDLLDEGRALDLARYRRSDSRKRTRSGYKVPAGDIIVLGHLACSFG